MRQLSPYEQGEFKRLLSKVTKDPFLNEGEQEETLISWVNNILAQGATNEGARVDKIISKLRRVADQCEAGGHKSRARMFRSLAKEFEGKRYL